MSLHLDKTVVANSMTAMMQFNEIRHKRDSYRRVENAIAAMHGAEFNAAARIPEDAYRDFDRQVKRIMVGDEGQNLVSLIPTKSVNIGKIVTEYGQVSDSGSAQASISGRKANKLDRSVVNYDGGLVLIHDDAFGRQWREVEAMRSEDFNQLSDDQANSIRAVKRSIANHVMDGVADVEYKGYQAYGIKNNPNTQSIDLGVGSGLSVDLTSSTATYEDFETAIVATLTLLQGAANNVDADIDFAVSSQIWFNTLRRESGSFDSGTIMERLLKIPGVKSITKTLGSQLTGNEFIAMASSDQYIQLNVGMAVNTVPVIRQMFNDDFNFVTWGAAGLLVKADTAGRSGVCYARAIS